jgi:hypothetical protein
MNELTKNYGFKPDTIEPDHYIFGGENIPDEILQPDGNWSQFLPAVEYQKKNGLETMNCSVYGTENAIETLMKRKYPGEYDYSERYVGVLAGTSPEGGSPHTVAETIRKQSGLIPESLLPFDNSIQTWEQYYSPKPMTPKYLVEGRKWLSQFDFKHEWVFNSNNYQGIATKQDLLKQALQRSPVAASVYAWVLKDGYYVKPPGVIDNHWVELYGYEDGKCWYVFDDYDQTHKHLAWDYDFGSAKKYYLAKKLTPQQNISRQPSLMSRVVELIKQCLLLLKK